MAQAQHFIFELKLRMRDSYTNPYETKRIESVEIFGLTNRIHETGIWKLRHETNLLNIDWIRESGSTGFVWIRKSIVLRIRRIHRIRRIFWKCVTKRIRKTNLLKIDWIRDSRYETNLLKSGFVIHDTVRISYTNPATLLFRH